MQTKPKLDTEPREGRQKVNIRVEVSYAKKPWDALIDEAYSLESDDHVFSAADHLRQMADRLDPPTY